MFKIANRFKRVKNPGIFLPSMFAVSRFSDTSGTFKKVILAVCRVTKLHNGGAERAS